MDTGNPLDKLTKLSKRELEVLKLRCEGLSIEKIEEQLFISQSTIRTYIARTYVKLDIDHLEQAERMKALFEIYCPAIAQLEDGENQNSQDDEEEDGDLYALVAGDPSRNAEEIEDKVTADEMILASQKSGELVHKRKEEPPQPPSRQWIWLLVGIVFGAILMWGFLNLTGGREEQEEPISVAQAKLSTNEPTIIEVPVVVTATPDPSKPVDMPVVQTELVVVTATPDPNLPSETPLIHTQLVVVTATEPPTTPTPTTTDTPAPSSLGVGDSWSDGRVSLKMTKFTFNVRYHIPGRDINYAISTDFEFENISGETILLRYASEDFAMVDNSGREYDCRIQYYDDVNQPVESYSTHNFIIGCGQDLVFDRNVTVVTLFISQFSSLSPTEWMVEVPR